MTSQPYGPTDQEHLSTPGVNQEFCVFSKNKFVFSSMQPLKLVTLQESEHCTLYCTLEPNCFFTEYNPTIKLCKMFSFLATCENLRNQGYDLIFSWKSSSIYSTLYDLCEHYAYRSVSRGGESVDLKPTKPCSIIQTKNITLTMEPSPELLFGKKATSEQFSYGKKHQSFQAHI